MAKADPGAHFQDFDRSRLKIAPLSDRKHGVSVSDILPLENSVVSDRAYLAVASRIREARRRKASVVMMMGAHVLRSGVQRYIIDLMEKGYLSCIAMNGACIIHDFELSLIGSTTESVRDYIQDGRFGFWQETGQINDIVSDAAKGGMGMGEAVGKVIEGKGFPYRDISILAAGHRMHIPITIHVGIGYDIVHQLPNCDGAAYGATSYRDFLRFAKILESLENGVVMNFGSAVMGPEVFLKALSMVRNVARQNGKEVSRFTTLVCDIKGLPEDYRSEALSCNPLYYFRPWKTMLVRTVADDGESFYIQGYHAKTIPKLWTAITNKNGEEIEDGL